MEIKWLTKILDKVEQLIQEDMNEYQEELQILKKREEAMEETKRKEDHEKLFYEGDFIEKKRAYLKMTPEERKATYTKNDEIDNFEPFKDDGKNLEDYVDRKEDRAEFYKRHKLNCAKIFLGVDGGYTIRRYKKVIFKEQ